MGKSYEHCGTEGYGGHFGNSDWSTVDWAAIQHRPTDAKTDFPPASYPESPAALSPRDKARQAFMQGAQDSELQVSVDTDTDIVRVTFPISQQQEGEA